MIHEIQCAAGHFADVAAGKKTFIMQKDTDAQYRVGDFLALNEYTEDTQGGIDLTGRCCLVEVVHIYTGVEHYLQPGTIVMSIRPCAISTTDAHRKMLNRDLYAVDIYGSERKGRE